MLLNVLAFVCLAKAQRDEQYPIDDGKNDSDQRNAMEESDIARWYTSSPNKTPVIFDNDHADDTWTSPNSTSDDSCTYVEQADGSILINNARKRYEYCHEFWECDNPDHIMFFKWNEVQFGSYNRCKEAWARFAWGTEENDQEVKCSNPELTETEKNYRNTGGNKIVWDYKNGESTYRRGVEAQILCLAPSDINECTLGTHDCSPNAECIKDPGMSEYICQCPPNGIKWGDQRLFTTAAGTISDPCFYSHPDEPSIEVFPIEWNGDTFGVTIEKIDRYNYVDKRWQESFVRCNDLGMTLPVPSNDAENDALINLLARPFFLGAHTSIDEDKWTNVYTGEEITYNRWGVDQPKNTGYADKVALMAESEWYDKHLWSWDGQYVMCIKVDYEEWNQEDVKLGDFFCETNLNRCAVSATCNRCRDSDNCVDKYYRCECKNHFFDGIELIANEAIVRYSECEYNSPDLKNTSVNIFTYDGKPTLFHYNQNYDYYFDYNYYYDDPYDHDFDEAVEYCLAKGMQLPAPNTEQQYEDLKKIPRNSIDDSIWLGYTPNPSLDAWVNIYNGQELTINNIDQPIKGDNYRLEMEQFGSFEWNVVKESWSNYYRSTLCIKAWM